MKYEKKFLAQEQQASETQLQSESQQAIHEFATPEEVLRFDAKRTSVPEAVAQRLNGSLQRQPPRSWWKRWFG
jgi:hypothetical protein